MPAVCLPWYDHVNRSTRESSHAPSHGELDIHGTLRPSHRGGGLQTCDSCRFGPSLALPLHVCSGSLFEGSLTLLSAGHRSWGRVLRAHAYLPTRYLSDPTCLWTWRPNFRSTCTASLELDGWSRGLGSSHGDCERLPRLLPTAKVQGRLQCNRPGIEVQLSVSKERLQRHLMDDSCSTRNAHALNMHLTQIFQMEISEQLSMASLEHVLLPR